MPRADHDWNTRSATVAGWLRFTDPDVAGFQEGWGVTDDQGAVFFKADGAKTAFPGLLGRIAQDKTASMILETRLSHVSYLRGRNWAAAVKRWLTSRPASR